VARTWFIIADTIVLAIVNIVLNYGLIFGNLGLPEMGIAGAGLASSIAESIAFLFFVIYILVDKKARLYGIFKPPKIDWELIKLQLSMSTPIVAQSVVGLGSWFVFFGIVENLGERPLAITNLVRMVYLVLSIPCWGFASGINTLVSNFIGQKRREAVIPITWKTAKICLIITILISLPVIFFPEYTLYPLLGSEDMSLIRDSQNTLYVLFGIITLFSVGGVFFNGLVGTGATMYGLKIQGLCAIGYLIYIYVVVEYTNGGLEWAWASEIFYWIIMTILAWVYLKGNDWHRFKF